jgi:hypothetical protein
VCLECIQTLFIVLQKIKNETNRTYIIKNLETAGLNL